MVLRALHREEHRYHRSVTAKSRLVTEMAALVTTFVRLSPWESTFSATWMGESFDERRGLQTGATRDGQSEQLAGNPP